MYMMREVLHCRPGKVTELTKKFKALNEVIEEKGYAPFRTYTDLSGENFWTLVVQSEAESMDDFEAMERATMSDERAGEIMAGYHDLILDGRRELYRVV